MFLLVTTLWTGLNYSMDKHYTIIPSGKSSKSRDIYRIRANIGEELNLANHQL